MSKWIPTFFALALFGLTAALFLRLQNTLLEDFRTLEQQTVRKDAEKAAAFVREELERMSREDTDWAIWASIHEALEEGGACSSSPLIARTLTSLGLDFFAFLDSRGSFENGCAREAEAGGHRPPLAQIEAGLSSGHPLLRLDSPKNRVKGLLLLSGEPYLTASRPVLEARPREKPGEPLAIRGALVVGRRADEDFMEQLMRRTDLRVRWAVMSRENPPADFLQALSRMKSEPVAVLTPDPGTMAGYALVEDLEGAPALVLKVLQPRRLYDRGRHIMRYQIAAVLVFLLLASAALLIVFKRLVLSPLSRFKARVDSRQPPGRASPRKSPDGLTALATGTIHTMLESLEDSHEALRESEERYRTLIETIPYGILELDLAGTVTFANAACHRIHGYAKGELEGTSIRRLSASPDDCDFLPETLERLARELPRPYPWTGLHRRRDGRLIDVQIDWNYKPDARGRAAGFICVLTDITEGKRAREEAARLATAVEQAAESIIITDPRGLIRYVNPAFERISGYSKEEAAGSTPALLKSGVHDDAFYEDLWRTISGGRVWKGHLVNRRRNGSLFEETASISPIQDPSGRILGYVAVKHDVTQEVDMEKQLRQSRKMEAIGVLAGGIAHDFNNILGAILLNTELALQDLDEAAPGRLFLDRVIKAAYRARDLVKQILAFSRGDSQEKRPLEMAPVVKEALKLLQASLPSTVEIRCDIGDDGGRVVGDPVQIHQVLLNLCANAAHAMKETGGTLHVGLYPRRLDEESARAHPDLRPGPYLVLEVRDTGHGMDGDTLERIFDPFFTTKGPDEGTGMGLSVVHGIVSGYGGAVTAESRLGEGSVFRAHFPRVEEEGALHPAPDQGALEKRGERILLVDDERILVDTWTAALEAMGCQVTGSVDGEEALERFRADPGGFDLVITDLTMPRKTGLELAREMRDIRPDLPVILCTGFGDLVPPEKLRAAGVRHVARKPLDTTEMARLMGRTAAPTEEDPRDPPPEAPPNHGRSHG